MTKETASSLTTPAQSQSGSRHIVCLIGFMGAGKTTVGRALAATLRWQFLDLDDLIQSRAGISIPEIFERQGESGFRALEAQLLKEIISGSPAEATVLSLGGGAFIDNTNRQVLRENEIRTVFLDAPVEELFRRCAQPGVVRPLLRDGEQFRALFEQRRPEYMKASVLVRTEKKEIANVVDEILSRLGLDPNSGALK